jgi:hypothetical protein
MRAGFHSGTAPAAIFEVGLAAPLGRDGTHGFTVL